MGRLKIFVFLFVAFCASSEIAVDTVNAAQQEETEVNALKREIADLKDRMVELESRLQRIGDIKSSSIQAEHSALETIVPDSIKSIAQKIEVHGYVDSSYIFNFNTPVPPNPRVNNLRVFDTDANGFMLNMAQLNFEKPVSKESPAGFRVDLDIGQDARLIHSNGLGNSNQPFDLQQAYAQLMLPFSMPLVDTLAFKAGKFATLQGAEVIESINNWNFSRSYLFGYAIPFTHTGLRAYYKPSADLPVEAYIGIVNGWDQTTDLNKAKSLEAQILVTPSDRLSFSVGMMAGPERSDSDKDFRNLIDLVVTYRPFDKLTLKANYDYGWEKNGASVALGSIDGKDAAWDGVAFYARYDIFDWWDIAARCEFFHDRDGTRTGACTGATGNAVTTVDIPPRSDLELWEITLTNEIKLWKDIIARLEYRHDKASGQVFLKDKITSNYQNTISGEVAYKF